MERVQGAEISWHRKWVVMPVIHPSVLAAGDDGVAGATVTEGADRLLRSTAARATRWVIVPALRLVPASRIVPARSPCDGGLIFPSNRCKALLNGACCGAGGNRTAACAVSFVLASGSAHAGGTGRSSLSRGASSVSSKALVLRRSASAVAWVVQSIWAV